MKDSSPFWFKSSIILLGIVLGGFLMIEGKFILMPLAFSALLAMLLNPVVVRLERYKISRIPAILITMTLLLIVFSGGVSLITWQFVEFADDLPEVSEKLKEYNASILDFVENNVGIAPEQQTEYIQRGVENLIDSSGDFVSDAVNATTSIFTHLSLMPIFIFFLLYYKEMYRTFLVNMVSKRSHSKLDTLIENVEGVAQNYIVGLLTVIGILALLNTLGLFIVGIEHAVFFGVFAAFMAIIPYIGIIIGSIPPLLYALFLADSLLAPAGVILVFVIVQFLEGNFITPRIVGSKVSINPFMALLALIIGGNLWGIAGMILFVPLIGILRVLFSQIDSLYPVGYLLGSSISYEEGKAKIQNDDSEQGQE